MTAEIRIERIGTKWHGYIVGRPDIDETALAEEAVRRKVEQLRDRIGTCGAKHNVPDGRPCGLIAGHRSSSRTRDDHRSGSMTWSAGSPDGRRTDRNNR
jgi:hypothetical protein